MRGIKTPTPRAVSKLCHFVSICTSVTTKKKKRKKKKEEKGKKKTTKVKRHGLSMMSSTENRPVNTVSGN